MVSQSWIVIQRSMNAPADMVAKDPTINQWFTIPGLQFGQDEKEESLNMLHQWRRAYPGSLFRLVALSMTVVDV